MGKVFLAEQRESIRRKVAAKWIRTGMDYADLIGRFDCARRSASLITPRSSKWLLQRATKC